MTAVGVAFKILQDEEYLPVGYTKSIGYLIFDININFTQKTRWVKDGYCTPDPKTSNYDGVFPKEIVCIFLTNYALRLAPVKAAHICSAYLQAPTSEKHYIICRPEFGLDNVVKQAKIV